MSGVPFHLAWGSGFGTGVVIGMLLVLVAVSDLFRRGPR